MVDYRQSCLLSVTDATNNVANLKARHSQLAAASLPITPSSHKSTAIDNFPHFRIFFSLPTFLFVRSSTLPSALSHPSRPLFFGKNQLPIHNKKKPMVTVDKVINLSTFYVCRLHPTILSIILSCKKTTSSTTCLLMFNQTARNQMNPCAIDARKVIETSNDSRYKQNEKGKTGR